MASTIPPEVLGDDFQEDTPITATKISIGETKQDRLTTDNPIKGYWFTLPKNTEAVVSLVHPPDVRDPKNFVEAVVRFPNLGSDGGHGSGMAHGDGVPPDVTTGVGTYEADQTIYIFVLNRNGGPSELYTLTVSPG